MERLAVTNLCLLIALGPLSTAAQEPPSVATDALENKRLLEFKSDVERLHGAVRSLTPDQQALELLKTPPPATTSELTILLFADGGRWTARYSDHGDVSTTTGRVVLPIGAAVELRPVSADLLYEMQFPELDFRFDALPGRIGAETLQTVRIGLFRGDCDSCGPDGAPLAISIVSRADFDGWIAAKRGREPG